MVGAHSVSSKLLSLSSSGSRTLTSRTPKGERILTSGDSSSFLRIEMTNGHSSLARCCPCCHNVCDETPLTWTLPLHEPGLMWSELSGSSLESRVRVGSLSHQGVWSQWGYLARMFITSVEPLRQATNESISRFVSLPTIVSRKPDDSSNRSVPKRMIQNSQLGSSIFAFATQKVFLIINIISMKRLVGKDSLLAIVYSVKVRWAAALRCSSCSERDRSTQRNGKMRW